MASSNINQGQHYLECDVCQNPVVFTCRRCTVKLCTTCVGSHLVQKSENGHDVVKYSELNETEGGNCQAHPKQQCSAFCKSCDIPICVLCVTIKHKTHEISELSEKADELSDFIAKENERLQSIRLELETILDHTRKRIAALPRVYKQSKDDITTRAREWHQEIEEIEKTFHEDLDKMQEKNMSLLIKQEKEFQEILDKIKSLKQSACSWLKSKDVSRLMELRLEIENLQVPSSVGETRPAYFQPCKLDKNYIATYFGYTERLKSFKISIDDMKLEDPVQLPRGALDVPTVLFTFNTEFPAEESYGNRLNNIVSLGDDRVWTGGCSKALKLFDLHGHLLDTVTISALGLYLTLHHGHIVYSDPNEYAIKNIKKGKAITLFQTGKWRAEGIACTAAGNLLTCLHTTDIKESKVVRYSTSGDVLQEIQYDSEYKPLFQKAVYVVENGNGDICVADWDKRALIVVDKYGIFRFSYSGNEASKNKADVKGLTTDSMLHIIITDFYYNKIHMLDKDGRFLRYIIPDQGIKGPLPVCVVKEGELMVGECITGKVKRIKYLQ